MPHPSSGCSVLGLVAYLAVVSASASEESPFQRRIYTNAVSKATLPYRLSIPSHYEPSRDYAIVVFLHGAIARGTDNEEPLNWGPKLWLEASARDHSPFFLVVPQCPKDIGWETAKSIGGPDPMGLLIELVRDGLPKEFKIDARRRYLTGVSMGGIALWSYFSKHPGFFAAGVPVCASGNPREATAQAAIFPMWVFHSDDDHLIPVQSAREMVAAWRAKGGVAKYTEYTGLKHSSWKKAYLEPGLLSWLFAQQLQQQTSPR